MNDIELYHEMPLSMLLDGYEDKLGISGHYALVHLYEKHQEYFNYSVRRLRMGYTVILDNSIFELGKAFDADRFAFWIKELVKYAGKSNVKKNLVYIIPDALDEPETTVSQCRDFLKLHGRLPGKKMAVAQGRTMGDLIWCYDKLDSLADMDRIGVSFNCEAYDKYAKEGMSKLEGWSEGRKAFVKQLEFKHGTRLPTPLHLLGCSLPQEFQAYQTNENIVSIDTSNPVVHGIKEIPYTCNGLQAKESIKLADLFLTECTSRQLEIIKWNTAAFRWFANGQ